MGSIDRSIDRSSVRRTTSSDWRSMSMLFAIKFASACFPERAFDARSIASGRRARVTTRAMTPNASFVRSFVHSFTHAHRSIDGFDSIQINSIQFNTIQFDRRRSIRSRFVSTRLDSTRLAMRRSAAHATDRDSRSHSTRMRTNAMMRTIFFVNNPSTHSSVSSARARRTNRIEIRECPHRSRTQSRSVGIPDRRLVAIARARDATRSRRRIEFVHRLQKIVR